MATNPTSFFKIAPSVLDAGKIAVNTGKAIDKAQNGDGSPVDNASMFGAKASALTGSIGLSSVFIKNSHPMPFSVIKEVKASAGVVPSLITMFAGVKNGDFVQASMGGLGLGAASGGFRVLESLAERSASNAIRNAPPVFKISLAVAQISYGIYQLNK